MRIIEFKKPLINPWKFQYLGHSQKLVYSRSPENVIHQISEFAENGLDQIVEEIRGSESFQETYLFDQRHRLRSMHDSFTSETSPKNQYEYFDGSSDQLSFMIHRTNHSTQIQESVVSLFSADGKKVGAISQSEKGYILPSFEWVEPTLQESMVYGPKHSSDLDSLTVANQLRNGHVLQGVSKHSRVVGKSINEKNRVEQNRWKHRLQSFSIKGQNLVVNRRVNDSVETKYVYNPAGSLVLYQDALGYRYAYEYDLLSRLKKITLPSGATQEMNYNPKGLLAQSKRTGIGKVEFKYDAADRLISRLHKVEVKKQGREPVFLERRKDLFYDSMNRMVRKEFHFQDESQTYEFHHDEGNQIGRLTSIQGPGYRKSFAYDLAGRRTLESLEMDRSKITRHFQYLPSGKIDEEKVEVVDGETQFHNKQQYLYDPFGKLMGIAQKDQLDLAYDVFLHLKRIEQKDKFKRLQYFDSLTLKPNQFEITSDSSHRSIQWSLNPFGLVQEETVKIGDDIFAFSYDYDEREFLKTYQGKSFEFDEDGLPHRFEGVDVSMNRQNLNPFGQMRSLAGWDLKYDPQGQIKESSDGTNHLRFLTDENGLRIAVLENTDLMMTWGNLRWQDQKLYQKGVVQGYTLGEWVNGFFKADLTDLRGSSRSTDVSPFGKRNQELALKSYDYANHPRTPLMGSIQMGVRHYSPDLTQFISPDHLFLDEPARCLQSPIECNLYSYAKNNPLKYVDPGGNIAETAIDMASVGASVYSISQWDDKTSFWSKAADVGGLVVDSIAAAIPLVPGGVGLGLKAARGADKALDASKATDVALFDSRSAAFRAAKRDAGIPMSQQPDGISRPFMKNRDGSLVLGGDKKPIRTREYHFNGSDGSRVKIQDHGAGHKFNQGGVGDQGSHFNVRPDDALETSRNQSVQGTKDHYNWGD